LTGFYHFYLGFLLFLKTKLKTAEM